MVIEMDRRENAEIRDRILDYLYKNETENPGKDSYISRDEMLKHLNVNEKLMDFNIYYLKDKRLINLREIINSPWTSAKITSSGIDKVEYRK